MTVFITKYALTTGILEVDGEVSESCSTMLYYMRPAVSMREYAHGREWHRTRAEAVAEAERMRAAKIKSLQKQADRIRALKFE